MSDLRVRRHLVLPMCSTEAVGTADLQNVSGPNGFRIAVWPLLVLIVCLFIPVPYVSAAPAGAATLLSRQGPAAVQTVQPTSLQASPVSIQDGTELTGFNCGRNARQHCTCPHCHGACGHCPKPLVLTSQFDLPRSAPAMVPAAPFVVQLAPTQSPPPPLPPPI